MRTSKPDTISSEGPACLVPWAENPYRLVSLWDMLRIHAENFVEIGVKLKKCSEDFTVLVAPQAVVGDPAWKAFVSVVERISKDGESLGLVCTAKIAETLKHNFYSQATQSVPITVEAVARAAVEIGRVYLTELKTTLFLHLAKPETFEQAELFGKAIADSFPTSAPEIFDAGNCYALEQDTACVMHLMRALETPLSLMASEFGVSSARENWQTIIEQIDSRVRNLRIEDTPDWRERQEFYSGACAQFMHFKNAWRNHAMHQRARYNSREAKRIMDHTKDFMEYLSTRLHE
jgi:hypothetical protein